MVQQAALERQALEQLRRGDLRAAHGTLRLLSKLRPGDPRVARRLEQIEALLERREEARERMRKEPLRYAHAYIKAGRLTEGLRLLRAALAQDPDNRRLRELALQVARRLSDEPSPAPHARASADAPVSAVAPPPEPAEVDDGPIEHEPGGQLRASAGVPSPSPDPSVPSEAEARVLTLRDWLARVQAHRRRPSRWWSQAQTERG